MRKPSGFHFGGIYRAQACPACGGRGQYYKPRSYRKVECSDCGGDGVELIAVEEEKKPEKANRL